MNGSREPWSYSNGKKYTTFIFIYLFLRYICNSSSSSKKERAMIQAVFFIHANFVPRMRFLKLILYGVFFGTISIVFLIKIKIL